MNDKNIKRTQSYIDELCFGWTPFRFFSEFSFGYDNNFIAITLLRVEFCVYFVRPIGMGKWQISDDIRNAVQ